jgi:hypothetical protein
MSEEKAVYNVGAMITLNDLKQLPSARLFSDPGYIGPTPGEVDALIKAAGWSQNEAAKIVGVTFNPAKGSQTIRKWRAPFTSPEYREIPYSAWRLMLLHAGVVSI